MSADLSVSGGEITLAGQAQASGWFVNRSHKITLKPSTVQNSPPATSRSPRSSAAHLRGRSPHSAARMSSAAPAGPATRASFSGSWTDTLAVCTRIRRAVCRDERP